MTSLLYERIRPEFHLTRWQYYEKARYELKRVELESAKYIFQRAKEPIRIRQKYFN